MKINAIEKEKNRFGDKFVEKRELPIYDVHVCI